MTSYLFDEIKPQPRDDPKPGSWLFDYRQREVDRKEGLEALHSQIMTLPQEIRSLIYNKLSQAQAIGLLRFNSDWNAEITSFYNFRIKLCQKKLILPELLQLRVRKVKVMNFLEPHPSELETIFKYPNLVKQLGIYTNKISRSNLHLLLLEVGEYLKKFKIHLRLTLLNSTQPGSFFYNLKSLKKLKILVDTNKYTLNGYERLDREDWDWDDLHDFFPVEARQDREMPHLLVPQDLRDTLLYKIIGSSSLNNIQSIHLGLKSNQLKLQQQFSNLVLSLLLKNWTELVQLNLEMKIGDGAKPLEINSAAPPTDGEDLKTFSSKELKTNLVKLSIININNELTLENFHYWVEFLVNQKNLVFLAINHLRLAKFGGGFFAKFVPNNFNTLTELHINSLTFPMHSRPLDVSCFREFVQLRKLTLGLDTAQNSFEGYEEMSDIWGLSNLPKSLKELRLINFKILSTDLISWFAQGGLVGLTKLEILGCGDYGSFGVNGSVVEIIYGEETPADKYIKFSEVNLQDEEELNKFNRIFKDRLNIDNYAELIPGVGLIILLNSVQPPPS